MSLVLASPAKINLFLYVTSRRDDGYHNLYSLMAKIGLADELVIDFTGKGVHVSSDHPQVPSGPDNLAHRAASLFFDACAKSGKSLPIQGTAIHIRKRVPVGGGLGGGSGNAAEVLKALNARCGWPFSTGALMDMGLKIGADVPFFIFGGPALAGGVGEKLVRVPYLRPLYVVLCNPGVSACTARVFKNMDFKLTSEKKWTINSVSNVLPQGGGEDVRSYLYNDLESSACKLYPEILSAREEMEAVLGTKVTMSGSGASLFALFDEHGAAGEGVEKLRGHWQGKTHQVWLTMLRNG